MSAALDRVADLFRNVPDDQIEEAREAAVDIAKALRVWASSDPITVPNPTGNVLDDAAALAGAAADSVRAKREARERAYDRALAVAGIVVDVAKLAI